MKRPVFFFNGTDPAPSDSHRSDKGATVVGAATPRVWDAGKPNDEGLVLSSLPGDWWFDFVYARVIDHRTKLSARQWSGMLHLLHQRFSFEKMVMDAGSGGGGVLIQRELRAPQQMIEGVSRDVIPICDQVEGPKLVVRGHFILHLFKRGDPGIDEVWPDPSGSGKSLAGDELLKDGMMSSMKEALDGGIVGFPAPVAEWYGERKEEVQAWPEERRWALKNLEAITVQLRNIIVATKEDGEQIFTKRGARQFSSVGHDDLALAAMLCYAAFLIWLQKGDWRSDTDGEDASGFSGWGGGR